MNDNNPQDNVTNDNVNDIADDVSAKILGDIFGTDESNDRIIKDAVESISACQRLIDSLDINVRESIDRDLQECLVTSRSCEGCVSGYIDSLINESHKTLQKMHGKISSQIQNDMAALFGSAISVGVPMPTEHDLLTVANGGTLDIASVDTATNGSPPPPLECPPGQILDNDGNCVDVIPECPTGMHWDANLQTCVQDDGPPDGDGTVEPSCPVGKKLYGSGLPALGQQQAIIDLLNHTPGISENARRNDNGDIIWDANLIGYVNYPGHSWPFSKQGIVVFDKRIDPPNDRVDSGITTYLSMLGGANGDTTLDVSCYECNANLPGGIATMCSENPPPPDGQGQCCGECPSLPCPPTTQPDQPPPCNVDPGASIGTCDQQLLNGQFDVNIWCDPCDVKPFIYFADEVKRRAETQPDELVRKQVYNMFGVEESILTNIKMLFVNPLLWATSLLGKLIQWGMGAAVTFAKGPFGDLPVNNMSWVIYTNTYKAVSGLFGRWFGFVPDSVYQGNVYISNYVTPYKIPTTDQVNALSVSGFIPDDAWETAIRMNGDCVAWQTEVKNSMKWRPDIMQALYLYRREVIDIEQLRKIWAKNGVSGATDEGYLDHIADQLPGFQDIVRFMLRDVADEETVKKYQYDDEFDQKYTGFLKDWAKWQNIPDDVAKAYWRAHWQLPSPTQLYEMLHRLRPDRDTTDDQFPDVKITLDDVRTALKVNDNAPYWVDPLLAISYRPLTRVDVRRMYEIGAIDLKRVEGAYRDLGYSPRDAKDQCEFVRKLSGPKRAAALGYVDEKTILKYYAEGVIDQQTGIDWYSKLEVGSVDASSRLEREDIKNRAATAITVKKALKKRYMTGEFTDGQLESSLVAIGIVQDRIMEIVTAWKTELQTKYKAPTVSQLCQWWTRGLISIDEFESRVINIGYSIADAIRIISACVLDERERRAKEVQALIDKQAADARRRERERKAAIKAAFPCKDAPKPTCPPGVHVPV